MSEELVHGVYKVDSGAARLQRPNIGDLFVPYATTLRGTEPVLCFNSANNLNVQTTEDGIQSPETRSRRRADCRKVAELGDLDGIRAYMISPCSYLLQSYGIRFPVEVEITGLGKGSKPLTGPLWINSKVKDFPVEVTSYLFRFVFLAEDLGAHFDTSYVPCCTCSFETRWSVGCACGAFQEEQKLKKGKR